METFKIILIIVIAILALIMIWYIATFNSLRRLEIRVEESLAGIDVALTKRFDVLTKMLETAKGYARHEAETLLNVVKQRQGSISQMPLNTKQEFVEELDRLQNGINVIVEQYPELKSDRVFENLQRAVMDVEEHLQAARRLYNSNVRILNERIVVFPSSIVASTANITKRSFFQADKDKIEDVKFEF